MGEPERFDDNLHEALDDELRREEPREREEYPLLRGRGQYLDDLASPDAVHVAFVRSPHARARVRALEVREAAARPGVLAILTGEELHAATEPIRPRLADDPDWEYQRTEWYPIARDEVRYVGEIVAAVVATDRYRAEDAAAQVEVDFEMLPAVADAEAATHSDAPKVHAALRDNILFRVRRHPTEGAEAFERAAVRVRGTFRHPRVAGIPMENCGALACYRAPTGELELWSSTQVPHLIRDGLGRCLGHPTSKLRVVTPHVGGGFGTKMQLYPEEVIVAYAARKLERAVRWTQDRMENLQTSFQARDIVVDAELAADETGRLIGLRARALCDVGAYSAFPLTCALEPHTVATGLPAAYRFGYFDYEGIAVATNKCPQGAYRGVGFPLGPLVIEGLLDRLARELEADPIELRLKNLVPPDRFPYASPAGAVYDSGDYPALLRLALERAGYADWRTAQRRASASRRRLGIGIACFVESTGMNRTVYRKRGMVHVPGFDSAVLRITPEGAIEAAVSTPTQGQGQGTTFRRLLARALEVAPGEVHIHLGDTATTPYGSGTFASRSVVAGGGALLRAARRMRERLIELAGAHWEIDPEELEYAAGSVRRVRAPRTRLTLRQLAELAYTPLQALPSGTEPGLSVQIAYDPPGVPFSAAVHLALVEVDVRTGKVTPRRYVVAEDCGPIINRQAVDGQIRGAVAQGVGTALHEEMRYDEAGQLLSATLMDYLVPGTCEVPEIDIVHMETPSPVTEGALKGVGESGIIGAPAAIAGAVIDALQARPETLSLPLTPERVMMLCEPSRREPSR